MRILRSTLNRFASSANLKAYINVLQEHAELHLAELAINNQCNLDCVHCSYIMQPKARTELDFDDWVNVATELANLGTKRLHICGKEPLLSPWLPELLYEIDSLRSKRHFRYGLVTNGTLLGANLHWLTGLSIDYIDISIDGLRHGHDALRGPGTFDKTVEQIELAIKWLGNGKLTLTTVLCSHNVAEIPAMIDHFSHLGIKYFFLQPVQLVGNAKRRRDLKLSKKAFLGLIDELTMKEGNGNCLIEISVDYQYKKFMFNSSDIFRRSCQSESLGQSLGLAVPLGLVQLSFNWMCYAYWQSCFITPFGDYLGCGVQAARATPVGPRIGNVTESPIKHLFSKSLETECLASFHQSRIGDRQDLETSGPGISYCPIMPLVKR